MNFATMVGCACPHCKQVLPATLYEVAGIAICPNCDSTLHWCIGALAIMSEADLAQLDQDMKRIIANAAAGVLLGDWLNDATGEVPAPQVTIYVEPTKH